MPIDRAAVDKFLTDVDRELLPKLADQRFVNSHVLVAHYERVKSAWHNGTGEVSALNEITNEICVACELLGAETAALHYEPPLGSTEKTIDFLVKLTNGRAIYFDVKTVHPDEGDAWERYESLRPHFTGHADLILNEYWMGGEIAYNYFAARQRFLEHTLALEGKIETNVSDENASYALVVCGNGFRWHESHLEDFADLYRTRRPRPDDALGNIQMHYMGDKRLSFRGTIDTFCYLERPLPSTQSVFRCNVHGWPFHK